MDVSIAGAGLIGRILGWRLTQAGHRVSIYERATPESPRSAAHVAAALIASASEQPETESEVIAMARVSRQIWPHWLKELKVSHAFDGTIAIAHPTDECLLRKFQQTLERHQIASYRVLNKQELAKLEPALPAHFRMGLLLEEEGWLDNRELLDHLASRCGAIYYGNGVDPCNLDADLVLDCRGAGSTDPDIRCVRGEIIRLYAPEVEFTRPLRLLHPKYRLYVSPRANHHYVIGATQIESDFEGGVTVQGALELLSAAYTLSPGFQEAEIVELANGLRAAYDDNNPRVQWRDGVLHVNGLYRHGFSIAPAIVNRVESEVAALCKSS